MVLGFLLNIAVRLYEIGTYAMLSCLPEVEFMGVPLDISVMHPVLPTPEPPDAAQSSEGGPS